MHRWRNHLVLIAAVLALLGVGGRHAAATLHWHPPAVAVHHDHEGDHHGHHHGHDHGHDEQGPHEEEPGGGCEICEAIAGGAEMPRLPDRVPLPVVAGFAAPLGAERAAVLLAVSTALARGPPTLI